MVDIVCDFLGRRGKNIMDILGIYWDTSMVEGIHNEAKRFFCNIVHRLLRHSWYSLGVNSRVLTTVRHESSFHRIFPKPQSRPRRLPVVQR